jgi:hypothetical protein
LRFQRGQKGRAVVLKAKAIQLFLMLGAGPLA